VHRLFKVTSKKGRQFCEEKSAPRQNPGYAYATGGRTLEQFKVHCVYLVKRRSELLMHNTDRNLDEYKIDPMTLM